MSQFERTELLIGTNSVEKLKKMKVAVFGIGGVGSYVVEALARCGVGSFDLIDKDVQAGTYLFKDVGVPVEPDEKIAEFDPYSQAIISEVSGKVKFIDLKVGLTVKEETDDATGTKKLKVVDSSFDSLDPRIVILNNQGEEIAFYRMSGGAIIQVKDGDFINAGDTIAKVTKKSSKAGDITGGLPRVTELFEARKPKGMAIISEIAGKISSAKKEEGIVCGHFPQEEV